MPVSGKRVRKIADGRGTSNLIDVSASATARARVAQDRELERTAPGPDPDYRPLPAGSIDTAGTPGR